MNIYMYMQIYIFKYHKQDFHLVERFSDEKDDSRFIPRLKGPAVTDFFMWSVYVCVCVCF